MSDAELDALADRVVERLRSREETPVLVPDGTIHFTARERQIVLLLGQGSANKEIAWQLGISVGAVKTYIYRLTQRTKKTRFKLALLGYALAQRDAA